MTQLNWTEIEALPAQQMSEARRQAHNAVHWLARVANSYIEPEDDNAHVALPWNAETETLRTRVFGNDLTVELRLGALEIQFCEGGQPVPHVLAFEERTPAHVEAYMLVELLHRDVDRDAFSKMLPYEAKDLMLGDHEEHRSDELRAELTALNGWMRNAAAVLTAVRHDLRKHAGLEKADPELVCWPETFQLGIDIPMPVGSGAKAIRAGLSAGDQLRPEPFFFVGTVDQAVSGNFDPASVLSVQRIPAEKMTADGVIGFLDQQIAAHRKRLAG